MIRLFLTLALFFGAPFLWADRAGWPLPPAESFTNVVTPPPSTGSPADRADLDAVIGM